MKCTVWGILSLTNDVKLIVVISLGNKEITNHYVV